MVRHRLQVAHASLISLGALAHPRRLDFRILIRHSPSSTIERRVLLASVSCNSTQAELEALAPKAMAAMNAESMLWISFPKGSSKIQVDLTRDRGWSSLVDVDLKWVNLVSVNATWSAFALRTYKPGEPRQKLPWTGR